MKKAGRPIVYDDTFYLMILQEFETLSLTELSKLHKVSRSTIVRWVRKGKEVYAKTEHGKQFAKADTN